MSVSPVVFVPRGEDAVLRCSFTHPSQEHYSGKVTVKWLARESGAPPFFSCSVRNNSMEGRVGCSASELKYSLEGDPRRGDVSLLFRAVDLGENGTYFCRVELDVEPQILRLSVVEAGPDSAPQRLRCEAEGHPLPAVTWLPAPGSPLGDQVETSEAGPYRRVSSVPYRQDDVFTCRAQSRLGAAERRFPDRDPLKTALT
ncbi:sialic acid-binding Ig-like lectin 15, partial [Etheostoma cragini]|uniref:sialic acid-binding Ig-like lectin 15 n=1 Tax=Etheostoma cragini TaxID=417921 RepID=UPI00155DFCC4